VLEDLGRRRCDIVRIVAPTAIVVFSVGELDRARSILSSGIDIVSPR
jgi:hypothetical protein